MFNFTDLLKANKPPSGYYPAPGSKTGGYRKKEPGRGYVYWYPGGVTEHPEGEPVLQAEYHDREVQNIKGRLRDLSGSQSIFKEYIGQPSLNKLRRDLENHRTASDAWRSGGAAPSKASLFEGIRSLNQTHDPAWHKLSSVS